MFIWDCCNFDKARASNCIAGIFGFWPGRESLISLGIVFYCEILNETLTYAQTLLVLVFDPPNNILAMFKIYALDIGRGFDNVR